MAQPGKLELPSAVALEPSRLLWKAKSTSVCLSYTQPGKPARSSSDTRHYQRKDSSFKGSHVLLHSYTTSAPQKKAPSEQICCSSGTAGALCVIYNCQGFKMKQRRNKPVLFGDILTKTLKHKLFEDGSFTHSPVHKFNSKPFLRIQLS